VAKNEQTGLATSNGALEFSCASEVSQGMKRLLAKCSGSQIQDVAIMRSRKNIVRFSARSPKSVQRKIFRIRQKPEREVKKQIWYSKLDNLTAAQCAAKLQEPLATTLWRIVHTGLARIRQEWLTSPNVDLSILDLTGLILIRRGVLHPSDGPRLGKPSDEILSGYVLRLCKFMDEWEAKQFLEYPHPDLAGISVKDAIMKFHIVRKCNQIIRRYEVACRRLTKNANSQ
jgi:hypothetical protein